MLYGDETRDPMLTFDHGFWQLVLTFNSAIGIPYVALRIVQPCIDAPNASPKPR